MAEAAKASFEMLVETMGQLRAEVEFIRHEMSGHRAAYELPDGGGAPALRSLEAIDWDASL